MKFRKQADLRFIGHLDIMRYFQKLIRRAGIPIRYSEGFNPHQVMSFASPLSVGHLSLGEYCDIDVHEAESSEDMVSRLNIPMVLTDTPPDAITSLMDCDCVTMENTAAVMAVVRHLAAAGARQFGFIGDYNHCGSFRERWYGFNQGLVENGLRLDERFCICESDDFPYDDSSWLISRLDRMPSLPDAFVCANDYLAIPLMLALKKKGLSIPRDIMVTGFDGMVQSAFTDPPLTTVKINGSEIGRLAAKLLLNRIRIPSFPYSWTRVKSTPVWRESTRDK